jgi:hypothetical protein
MGKPFPAQMTHVVAVNGYANMDKKELALLAYRMERTLRSIQLRQAQDPAILAGAVVSQAVAARGGC